MGTYEYTLEEAIGKIPVIDKNAHKGNCGKILIIAGSKNISGAAYLCAKAAYRSGAGLVYIYTPECNRVILQTLIPEAILYTYGEEGPDDQEVIKLSKGKDAIAFGPGVGVTEKMKKILHTLLLQKIPVVLDADGITNLSHDMSILDRRKCDLIITPHPGEMIRICGKSLNDLEIYKEGVITSLSRQYGIITVLKGHNTLVSNGRELYRNCTGNQGMATAGSGDVLTGVIAALVAQKLDSFEAAKLGVYFHGKAGDDASGIYGMRSLMAGDIADYLFRGL